jgi:glycerol-3-phosphate dehydrogenase (NAD(P)+)
MGKVAILGAGRWGSALGLVLSRKGNEVMLFDRNPSVVEALKEGKDPYWGIGFEKKPLATTHLEEVLEFSQCILIALPVQVIRKVLEGKDLREKVFISASKGLEVGTNKRVSEVLEELFPDCQVLALSGPSFAEETAKGLPCAVVLAGEDVALLREVSSPG